MPLEVADVTLGWRAQSFAAGPLPIKEMIAPHHTARICGAGMSDGRAYGPIPPRNRRGAGPAWDSSDYKIDSISSDGSSMENSRLR